MTEVSVAMLRKQRDEAIAEVARLQSNRGGDTPSGMSADALKPRVDFLHTAFLWLAGLLVTGIVAILGVIVTLSSSTNLRVDKLGESVSTLNRQVGEQTSKMDESNRRLDRIETKIDRLLEK